MPSGHQAPPSGASVNASRRARPLAWRFALHVGGQGKGQPRDAEHKRNHHSQQRQRRAAQINAHNRTDQKYDYKLNHAQQKVGACLTRQNLATRRMGATTMRCSVH